MPHEHDHRTAAGRPALPARPEIYLPPEESGIDIKDLLAILRRRRRVILSTVLVLTSVATLAGLQVTPKYTASALVMIDPRQSNVVDMEAVIQGLGTDASTVESQIRVIGSRFQLERLAEQFDVVNDPEFNLALRTPERAARGGSEDAEGDELEGADSGNFAWLPESWRPDTWLPDSWLIATGLASEPVAADVTDYEFGSLEREEVIEAFGERFKVVPEGRSYVIKLSFTSENAQKAAWVANGAAEL